MKNAIEVNILEQKLFIKSDEGEEYIKEVEDYLQKKVEEIKKSTKAVSTLDLALLTALNLAGDYLKISKRLDELDAKSNELVGIISRRLG